MRTLLIGSWAAHSHRVDFGRDPKDWDYIADNVEMRIGNEDFGFKVDILWDVTFEDWLPEGTNRVATLDELTTLKLSHSAWELRNGSWRKHMRDFVILRACGGKVDEDLYKLLRPAWERLHGRKPINLNQDSRSFFTDAVQRRYDHDSLHRSVAYTPGKPLYENVLRDGAEVEMDMGKIRALAFEEKVRLFREEIYATALERILIPSGYTASPTWAYRWALQRTITSLLKGWSSRFVAENYLTFLRPDHDYLAHHLSNTSYLIELDTAPTDLPARKETTDMDDKHVERLLLAHEFDTSYGPGTGWMAIRDMCAKHPDGFDVPGLGHVRQTDHGCNAGRTHQYLVVAIDFETGGQLHYRIDGCWDSWDCTWDGRLYQVTPRTETRTVYEPVTATAA
ncbi:hypothetical protein NONI108955_21080 [Nocardia ninae]|uniref:Uncharacterized protein n=1 Tax=Nocardia ninae NBRC 108245 TaxID=1210091 RepID=A0A511MBH1_9NOCA|nr:hypothetical protein [Nocardia ninae]GEM37448.1 hypothetical protein NN4_19670 [Nocardia ninae NBRC 108245]